MTGRRCIENICDDERQGHPAFFVCRHKGSIKGIRDGKGRQAFGSCAAAIIVALSIIAAFWAGWRDVHVNE
ncbi:hypothetical protein ETC05_09885 [Geobacillus sp. BMUD]|nr:hypothetical protein [Geobacillus sp. BMUD]